LGSGSNGKINANSAADKSAQKIEASATTRTACSAGNAVRPKGPNGAHRSFRSDQQDFVEIVAAEGRRLAMGTPVSAWMSVKSMSA